jgi:L-fuconolactonase
VIVDAHIHFWRLARGDNSALDASMRPLLSDHEPATLRPLLDACGVSRIVVVQAAETLAESLYTIGMAAATPWIAGVVGWIDLQSPSLREEIAALCRTGLLRGFRPVRDDNRSIAWMLDARNAAGLHAIAHAGLVLDVLLQNSDELPLVTHLAARHPELKMVLDHCGKPDVAGKRFQPWADDLASLARHRHVTCKLSGLLNRLGRGDDVAELEPYAAHVLRCFGPSRTLWASDWPPLLLAGDYSQWWKVTTQLLAALDEADRAAVLGGTATRVYRLPTETRS